MIPDYAEPVIVMRCWRTGVWTPNVMERDEPTDPWEARPGDRTLLWSAIPPEPWPVDGPLRARCWPPKSGGRVMHRHPVPDVFDAPVANCTCGIYGLFPEHVMFDGTRVDGFPGAGVIGFAAVWGRAFEGPLGIRAQLGRPVSLVSGSLYDGRFSPSGPPDAVLAAARYSIPACDTVEAAFVAARDALDLRDLVR